MKKLILIVLSCIVCTQEIKADAPCSLSSGNSFRRNSTSPRSGYYQVSLDYYCAFIVTDFRSNYTARVSKAGWRLDSVRQSLAIGSAIFPLSAGRCPDGITKPLTLKAYFRNTRLTANPRDDQFCELTIVDTLKFVDRLPPVARSIFINTTDLVFEPSHLKSHFGSSVISDNCTNLSILQDNIEFASFPPRPIDVPIYCDLSRNTYRVGYRTKDLCGNFSNWAIATVTFTESIEPVIGPLTGPSEIIVNNTCNSTLSRSQFSFMAVDDQTSSDSLIFSYRVISPLSISGNIPVTGKVIDAHSLCLPDNIITIRICVQDCSGNGNLHLSDNLVTGNCRLIDITVRDTTPPLMTLFLAPVYLPINISNCTAIMPNLTDYASGFVTGTDNCSEVSIYQLPAPGSILNNGVARGPGLASGVPRTFECDFIKELDTVVNCINFSGPFKAIPVSFLAVDCNGNCRIMRNVNTVYLTTIPSPLDLTRVDPEKLISTTNEMVEPPTLTVQNYPNPFNESTQMNITCASPGHGEFRFFNIHGREILRKTVPLYKGLNTSQITKSELHHSGIIFYTLTISDKISGAITRMQNKMMLFD